jgi:hypothetical protein
MRQFLLAGVLAAAAAAALPDRSHAWGNDPYNAHGFGWLGQLAFNTKTWIHMDGPLFNYGPYYLPGHQNLHIPYPYHGAYTPADPNLWNGGFGVYGSSLPAPAAGYAPHAVPPIGGPPQPYVSQAPTYYPQQQYIVPVVYPSWVTGR